ncbi:MAG: hypothetical protein RSE41_03645 [Clostridia bacterium]
MRNKYKTYTEVYDLVVDLIQDENRNRLDVKMTPEEAKKLEQCLPKDIGVHRNFSNDDTYEICVYAYKHPCEEKKKIHVNKSVICIFSIIHSLIPLSLLMICINSYLSPDGTPYDIFFSFLLFLYFCLTIEIMRCEFNN